MQEGHPIDRRKGLIITASGVLILTPDTLLVRLAECEPYTLAALRGLGLGLSLLLAAWVMHRGQLRRALRSIPAAVFVGAALSGFGNLLFVVALDLTHVANVLIAIAVEPLFAALLSWLLLREKVTRATALAMLGGFAGIAIVVGDSLGETRFWGDLAAIACSLCFAYFFVVLRRAGDNDMTPAVGVSGLFSALLALPLVWITGEGVATVLSLDALQWLWVVLMSLLVGPLAFALISAGPRYLPAAEVSLLILLETVLGPLWVWLALGEEPTPAALVGGAVVLLTLALHSLWGLRQRGQVQLN
ncbi:MAG TPA: DMT family transporter [Kiloniellales bacterium]|nr:DMT family transporter [Kiloniellales bacterium]